MVWIGRNRKVNSIATNRVRPANLFTYSYKRMIGASIVIGCKQGKACQKPEVCAVDGKYASKEERGQVGHESRSKETADDAHAHAKGPEHGDG